MDQSDEPLGFFDLPRELRNIIYSECGYYTLREGSPTLNLVEVELTKHCSPDLRLVSRQFKAEFEDEMSRQDGEASLSICFMNTPKTACFRTVSDMYAATARRTSQNLFTVCIIRPEGASNTLPPPTFAQTVLSIRPNAQLRQLSLTCSIDRANVQDTLTFAEKLLSQFSSISIFKMQIHQWLIAPPHSAPDPGDMDYSERVAERIRNFKLQQGLNFEFEVRPLFRSILMAAVGGSDEVREMFEISEELGENIIIYRGVPSNSKYAFYGFELFVHAVHVGEDLQAYLSS